MNELNRRDFLASAAVACALCACARFAEAAEAPTGPVGEKDAGPISKFDKDGIWDDCKMPEKGSFIIVRDGQKIYAMSSRCTHKGNTVRLQDGGLFCPGHKATFDKAGKPTKGPPKANLFRLGIRLNDDKHVIVDVSKKLGEKEAGGEGSFIEIKS